MNEQENESQEEANATNDDVSVSKERIFSAEDWRCWQNEQLCSIKLRHGIIWNKSMSFKV